MAPRYSIIPGAFAEDPRPRHLHYRVLNLLGRQTDNEGWCRLKQKNIGAFLQNEDGTVVHRVTVNRVLRDLVEWGYLEKHQLDASGRALWYRVIMDRPGGPPKAPLDGNDYDDDQCSETATSSSVVPAATSGVAIRGYSKNDPSLPTKTFPKPHGASATGLSGNSELIRKADALIARLKIARVPDLVIENLLRPILELRRFSSADQIGELTRLACSAESLSEAALRKAAEIVLDLKIETIKPARIADAIEKARVGGAMVPIRRGTPQWHRWFDHFGEQDPRQAEVMNRFDVWQVASEWPPATGCPQGAGA